MLEGIGVATKWNFKTKSLTVLPEVGFKFEAHALGMKRGEVSFKEGAAVTFDRNGQPTDLAWVMEAGASMRVGAATVGGTVNLTASAVTGIKPELGRELALSR